MQSGQANVETGHLIFLVDDDVELRTLTADFLRRNGLSVGEFDSADEFFSRLDRLRPDVAVLDVMMPGTDGLSACRRLRAAGDTLPVILLTARGDESDRIDGLNAGADDYIGKPFSPRELLARIHVALRRRPVANAAPDRDGQPMRIGDWLFLPASRMLRRGAETVRLRDAEYALLRALVSHPYQPLSRERLLQLTHTRPDAVFDRSVDVAMHRLRRLIERDPGEPRHFQTLRGHGYVFVPEEPSTAGEHAAG